jgi:isopentenyldiphosphate isomerase
LLRKREIIRYEQTNIIIYKVPFADKDSLENEEWFPVVTEDGTVIQKATRSICHDGKSKLLHPVVHLHLFNVAGELFLQKRALTKDIQPGKWDTSVGGHAGLGESINEALKRETYEELGLKNIRSEFILKYIWESSREKELVYSFYACSGETPVVNKSEIDLGRFWSFGLIKENLGKGIFTPNFEFEFGMIHETLYERYRSGTYPD